MRRELIDQIRSSLFTLKEGDRDMPLICQREPLNIAEISDALGISADATGKRSGRSFIR